MPFDPGGASGGGTTSPLGGACWISPADLASQIDPLLDRIAKLEERVAKLELGNVEANQLSDLATQTGWITNYTFMGVGGWTLTEAGTLIPPPGMSLSSLGIDVPGLDCAPYQFVSMDENGQPIFAVSENGEACGSSVETWNNPATAGIESVLYRSAPDTAVAASGTAYIPFSAFASGINFSYGNCWRYPSSLEGSNGIDVTEDGIYRVTIDGYLDWATTPSTGQIYSRLMRRRGGSTVTELPFFSEPAVLGGDQSTLNPTMVRRFLANDVVLFRIANSSDQNLTFRGGNITIEKLRGL